MGVGAGKLPEVEGEPQDDDDDDEDSGLFAFSCWSLHCIFFSFLF
jgi:hypothetical protein